MQTESGRPPWAGPPGAALLALLFGAAAGCESTTTPDPSAVPVLAGTFSLFGMNGFPTDLFCTTWLDPDTRVARGEIDTQAYFFMYSRATLTFDASAGLVNVRERLLSCGGDPKETIEVDLQRTFEQRGSLILITRLSKAGTYVDNAVLRGDTLILQARRVSSGSRASGTIVMAYIRDS